MMHPPFRGLALAITLLLPAGLAAQGERQGIPERQLNFETGAVSVRDGVATIDLPDGWRYLQQKDARYVVEELWGNPPDPSTHGLVVPPASDKADADSWAIIVSFSPEGYVSDADAAGIDYDELLSSMKSDSNEANAARAKEGYEPVELLGWAESPHYDAGEKKLYWAKRLKFGSATDETLNYDVRILGRRGVLVMQAVAGVAQLAEVARGSKQILAATSFAEGHRYSEFDPSLDEVAAYGIGGLIAGKVLLKAGLFKLLLKPLLVVGAIVVGVIAKMLGKGKGGGPDRPRRPRRAVQADVAS